MQESFISQTSEGNGANSYPDILDEDIGDVCTVDLDLVEDEVAVKAVVCPAILIHLACTYCR